MISVRQIEIIWAIIRTGSATGAGQLLGLSQPAISKVLRHTEDQMGMKLFSRRSGRLIPTAEADLLFPMMDMIFENVESVRRASLDLRDHRSGLIKVAAIPTLASTFLPASIGRFTQNRPLVRMSIKVLPTLQVIDRVARRLVDIGILFGPMNDTSMVEEDLTTTEIVCVLPRGHALSTRDEITPGDLQGERLISVNPISPWGLLIDQVFQSNGIKRDAMIECNHSIISYGLVEAGAGVAVVEPLLSGDDRFVNVIVRPFRPRLQITVKAIRRRSEPVTRLNAAFIEQLRSVASGL